MKQTIITIEREYGSGGSIIGKRLAAEMGIPYYNHEILEMAAQRLNMPVAKLEGAEESTHKSFLYSLLLGSNPNRVLEDTIPMSDQLYMTESQIIKELAATGSCIIVGRCGNYILRDNPSLLSLFIYAPKSYRLDYAQTHYGTPSKDASTLLAKIDGRREKFYAMNTGGNWYGKENYSLCLNSAVLGEELCVEIIKQACQAMDM